MRLLTYPKKENANHSPVSQIKETRAFQRRALVSFSILGKQKTLKIQADL